MVWDGTKWGQEDILPTNPDFANMFGKTDLDFENFHVFVFWNPNFWISRSPDLKIPRFLDFQVPTLSFPVRRGPFTNLPYQGLHHGHQGITCCDHGGVFVQNAKPLKGKSVNPTKPFGRSNERVRNAFFWMSGSTRKFS